MKNYMQDISSKNQKHFHAARQLAEQMLLTAKFGEADCENDDCFLTYGIIRDCAYKIRRTVQQELGP